MEGGHHESKRRDRIESGAAGAAAETARDYDSAFDLLRSALVDVADAKASPSVLRMPVRQLCVYAHAEEVTAEQLLIRFKELWSSLPPLVGLPRGRQRNDLMARVATMCIEEFYGPPADGKAPHDS